MHHFEAITLEFNEDKLLNKKDNKLLLMRIK